MMRNQFSRMIPDRAMPHGAELAQLDRSLRETELLSYSSLSARDLYRAHQLQLFENLLSECAPPIPNFTGTNLRSSGQDSSVLKRRYFRKIAAHTLPQILSVESLKEASVIKEYYPMTDQLLVAVHWPAPDRKMLRETWSPQISKETLSSLSSSECRNHSLEATAMIPSSLDPHLVTLKTFSPGAVLTNSYAGVGVANPSSGNASADASPIIADTSSMIADCALQPFVQKSITVMPAGNALVMMKQTSPSLASWLTIYTEDNVLGLRFGLFTHSAASKKEKADIASALAVAAAAVQAEKEQRLLDESRLAAQLATTGKKKGANVKAGRVVEEVRSPVTDYHIKTEVLPSNIEATISSSPPSPDVATLQDLAQSNASFFIHTDDDVRMVCYMGAATVSAPRKKPDTRATVCLSCVYPSDLEVLLCTTGMVKYTAPPLVRSRRDVMVEECGDAAAPAAPAVAVAVVAGGYESYRIICAGGTIVRHFAAGIYSKELMSPDGSRVLVRRTMLLEESPSSQQDPDPGREAHGFDVTMCQHAPADWTYVRLSPIGTVLFYCCPLGSVPEPRGVHMTKASPSTDSRLTCPDMSVPSDSRSSSSSSGSSSGSSSSNSSSNSSISSINIRSVRIDAETLAEINSFADGRIIVRHRDGLREVAFPDGTRATTHQGGSLVFLSKEGLPPIEVDVEKDLSSAESSRGVRASLSKRGDQVRLRVALPDGSAAVIKYDNRITSDVKGTIKVVRRDRTVVIVKDTGVVSYHPHTAWDDAAAAALSADSKDADKPPCITNVMSKALHDGPTVTFVCDDKGERNTPIDAPPRTAGDAREQNMHGPNAFHGSIIPPRTPHTATRHAAIRYNALERSAACTAMTCEGAEERHEGTSQSNQSISVASLSDPLLPLRPNSTKFTIDLFQATCKVEDHDYNIFNLSLKDLLNPSMLLSGEVDGLKPTSVSVSSLEPRLFVLNRSGEATEVLSTLKVSELERMVAICPDANKTVSSVTSQPEDLVAGKQHIYHLRQYLSRPRDALSFEEIFASRPWHTRATPAALSTHLERAGARHGVVRNAHRSQPPLMSMISLTEYMPLSQEGYGQLTKDFAAYEQYLLKRSQAMELHQAGDDMPICEVNEEAEERCRRAVRAAYKAAKILRNKQREEDKIRDESAGIESRKGKQGVPKVLALGATSDALLEEDGEEGDDDDLADSSDDDGMYESAEEREVRAAFESFATREQPEEQQGEQEEGEEVEGASTIYYSDIRSGCIQVLNCHVSQIAVDGALMTAGYCDIHHCCLSLEEFKKLLKM